MSGKIGRLWTLSECRVHSHVLIDLSLHFLSDMTLLFGVSLILSVMFYGSTCFTLNFSFICEKRGQKFYVQVTYLLASPETIDREFRDYDSIRDGLP